MKITNKILLITGIVMVSVLLILIIISRFIHYVDTEKNYPVTETDANEIKKEYDISGFEKIEVNGAFKIKIYQSSDFSIEVHARKRLYKNISILEQNKNLIISLDEHAGNIKRSVRIDIGLPELNQIVVKGIADIDFSGFQTEQLILNSMGVNSIKGTGNTIDSLILSSKGPSILDLRRSLVKNAVVDIADMGKVELTMNGGSLTGNMGGLSNLTYYGNVKTMDINTSGMAKVEKR